jgi:hypothetical protein
MKYLINKQTGKRYCLHCRSYECICLPESNEYFDNKFATVLEVKEIIMFSTKAHKLIFYKQKLPNGKLIKGNSELVVPKYKYWSLETISRPVLLLSNDIINKSFCG